MLRRLKRRVLRALKWLLGGEQFKRYAPHNPAPQPGPRLRIGIVFLIPLLGDAVMLYPLLDALREHNPDAEIIAFVSGMGKILRFHPAVDRVFERPARSRFAARLWPVGDIGSLWLWWFRQLRDVRLDVCIMPRGGSDPFYSTHLGWLLGAPVRAGYDASLEPEREHHDIDGSALLTHEIKVLNAVHEVDRGSEVLQLAGLLSEPVDSRRSSAGLLAVAQRPEARQFVASHPQLSQTYFILSPGASAPLKEWPESGYVTVAKHFASRGWLPVVVGGAEVRVAGDRLAASLGSPVLNLAGETGFPELAAVCAGARLFVGNDSGTGHVAGAVGTPAVILSSYAISNPAVHQTSPLRTHPVGPWYAVVQPAQPLPPCTGECSASSSHCITQIESASVLAACEDLLALRESSAQEVNSVS